VVVLTATVNKDFKVKNGLVVANGGSFGGSVSVGTPTLGTHAATKAYVDSLTGGMPVGTTPPSDPVNGQLWFDTLTSRVNVFYVDSWLTIATIDDTLSLPDHIHDTSIDGNGLIVSQFISAGSFNDPQGSPVDGGSVTTSSWTMVYDGGVAVDNFN
jgi:hypothetical protein